MHVQDAERKADKLVVSAPSTEDSLVFSRLMIEMRRRRLTQDSPLYQACVRILTERVPSLKQIRYQVLRRAVPSSEVIEEAGQIIERILSGRRLTLVEALHQIPSHTSRDSE